MKKIFGMLSLIAILTVAFSSNAIASDAENVSTEFVASLDSPDFVVLGAVEAPTVEFFNVADVSVSSLASGEGVDSAEIVSGHEHTAKAVDTYNKDSFSHEKVFLPFEVGWSAKIFNTKSTLSKYESHFNTNGYETPLLVKRISANIGKFTKPLNS